MLGVKAHIQMVYDVAKNLVSACVHIYSTQELFDVFCSVAESRRTWIN